MIADRRRPIPSLQQQAVINHEPVAPALVDAGAGTGKTYTIVERVARMDADREHGCAASSILLLTFSNKAAGELRGRIIRRLGAGIEPPECATFHAFALSLLKDHAFELELSPDFTLINEVDARVEFQKAFEDLMRGSATADGTGFALRYVVVDDIRKALFDIREQLRNSGTSIDAFRQRALAATDRFARTPYRQLLEQRARGGPKTVFEITDAAFAHETIEERMRIETAAALFRDFDERLRRRNVLTYAQLLDEAERAIRSHAGIAASLRGRFRHCIVDEFQDTDQRQVRLLAAIFGDALERVAVVGDPRQSIYAFRGSRPGNVDDFRRLPGCTPFALTENRRSRQEILDLAHAVIRPNTLDPAPLQAVRGEAGEPIVHAASRWAPPGDRPPNAAQSRVYEARWVVSNVAALLESGRQIERQDAPGEFEPIAPHHIAILSRRKTKLQPLIEALVEANVPFRQYGGAGFYEAPEVLDALAWFRLLADPLNDTAVARVISSPSIGACDATIVSLRRSALDDERSLALRALVDPLPDDLDDEGRERIERLRRVVDALEEYAGAPLATAWEATLDRAGLFLSADVRGGRRSDQARANLEKLSAMVRSFSARNPGSRATDFVHYIEELSLVDADDQEADPPSADAVSVMTIHAAKGLEWPIVFLIDVWPEAARGEPRVRIDPATGALLVSEGGEGTKPFHTEAIERQDDGSGNVPREKDARKDPERDEEERRLFYVGITRARDELFVSGRRGPKSKDHPDGRPAAAFLREAIDWLERDRAWPTIDEPSPAAATRTSPDGQRQSASFALSDFVGGERAQPDVAVPTLSFSSLARFERCPRSANYRLALRIPPISMALDDGDESYAPNGAVRSGRSSRRSDDALTPDEYGSLVHRALELWARSTNGAASGFVSAAVSDLAAEPSTFERERASKTVEAVMATLRGWRPLLIEAPFMLDFDGVSVAGIVDLVAADPQGNVFLIDYKTGTADAREYALQLGLYREAVREAYGIEPSACRIARVADGSCVLEEVEVPDADEVRRRAAAVAAGIRSADLTAKPGDHCAHCPYRAAPCMDFPAPSLHGAS